MKTKLLLWSALLSVTLFSSCKKENDWTVKNQMLDRKAAFKETYAYLSYSEGQFSLLLSREDAKKLLISDDIYDEMLKYLSEANKVVAEMVKNNPNIQFFDPSTMLNKGQAFVPPIIQTRSEIWDYQGSGSMPNQDPAFYNLRVPAGYSAIKVDVFSNALV